MPYGPHSGFYMDQRGIFTVQSSSYPDAVWHEYAVEFGQPDSEARFEAFCQQLLENGAESHAAKMRALLTAKARP